MEYEIKINDAIKGLNKRYLNREEFDFIKGIDSIVSKIDIESAILSWIFFVKNSCLECYINSKNEDYSVLIEDAEFLDEPNLYFVYKILLELHGDHDSITIRIKAYRDKKSFDMWKHKKYFQKLLNNFEYINSTKSEQIKNLDALGKEIDIMNRINIHRNHKSASAHLLDIKKNISYRVSKKDTLKYKIHKIKKGQVKKIICPICEDEKTLYWNNKNELFKFSKSNVYFICDHIGSESYGKLPVKINIKKYKDKIEGIDEIDWVIYNYRLLFEEFKYQMDKNYGLDYVI